MKIPKTPPVGLFIGFLLGGGAHYFTSDQVEPPHLDGPNDPPALTPTNSRSEVRSSPTRPSFEQVCEATGVDATGIVARFLAEASIDEIRQLMWFGMDHLAVKDRKENESAADSQASQDVIRLLGGERDAEAPWSTSRDPFESIDVILAEIDSASPARLRGWLKSLIATPHSSELILNAVVARLAASDPAGAFALVKGEDAREHHLTTVLVAWAKDDLSTAIDAVVARDNRSLLLKNLITGLDGAKCEELYEDLIHRGYHLSDPSVLWSLFEQLAVHDLEGSLSKALDASLNADSKDRSIDHAMTQWYKDDPTAALKWANDQEDPKALKLAMEAFARVAVKNSGAEGLDLVWDQLDEGQRKALLDTNFRPSTEDLKGWFDWMDNHVASPILHQKLMERLLGSLNDSEHPERMSEILSTMSPDLITPMMAHDIHYVSQRWAMTDLEGLQEWMKTLESPNVREAAEKGLIDYWADADPMKVIEFWERSNAEEYRTSTGLPSHILAQLFEHLDVFSSEGNPQALIDLLPESLRDEAMISYISVIVKESPREAIRLLESQPDGNSRNEVIQQAVARWVSEDPVQASEWVTGMEEGESKIRADQNLANTWARFDLEAAQSWIAEQPASESRDWAIKEYAKFAADYFPQDTLSLAMTVTAQPMKDEIIRVTMAGIARRDPDGASELAETANLPDALRQEFTQMIEKARAFEASFESRRQ